MSDQYGEPHYPSEPYPDPYGYGQPTHAAPANPSGGGPGQRGILIALGAVVVAGLVVIVLAIAGVFSGDSEPVAQSGSATDSTTASSTFTNSNNSTGDGTTSDTPSFPTTLESSSSSSSGTGSLGNLCANSSDAAQTAKLFVSAITLSSFDLAKGCVYPGAISEAALRALVDSDAIYSPTIEAGETGPSFTFPAATGGGSLVVRVEKKSDGRYYVTDVKQS